MKVAAERGAGGEGEPLMTPLFATHVLMSKARPILPAWLDALKRKAADVNSAQVWAARPKSPKNLKPAQPFAGRLG